MALPKQDSGMDMLIPMMMANMKPPPMPGPQTAPTTSPSTFKPQNPAASFVGGAGAAPAPGMTGTKTLLGQ